MWRVQAHLRLSRIIWVFFLLPPIFSEAGGAKSHDELIRPDPRECVLPLVRLSKKHDQINQVPPQTALFKKFQKEVERTIHESKDVPRCNDPREGCTAAALAYAKDIQKLIYRSPDYRKTMRVFMLLAAHPLRENLLHRLRVKFEVKAPAEVRNWFERLMSFFPIKAWGTQHWHYHHAVAIIESNEATPRYFSQGAIVFDPIFSKRGMHVTDWAKHFEGETVYSFAVQAKNGRLVLEPGSPSPKGDELLLVLHYPKPAGRNILYGKNLEPRGLIKTRPRFLQRRQKKWLEELRQLRSKAQQGPSIKSNPSGS